MNGFNRETWELNRRPTCSSEYHYAPQCPHKENRPSGPAPYQRVAKRSPSKPYSSIGMESPLHVQPPELGGSGKPDRPYEQSFSTTLEIGGQFVCARDDSVAVLDAVATANLVRSKSLDSHNSYLQKRGWADLSLRMDEPGK